MKKPRLRRTREDSLSRSRIVEASVALLDSSGEAGLTFPALSKRLATGPGAIYGHIANKSDLLTAACDAIVAEALKEVVADQTPEATIRQISMCLFDAISAHPWIGSTLWRIAGQMPTIRILEALGQQVRALGISPSNEWVAISVLINYISGVGGQNAANAQYSQDHADWSKDIDRMSVKWSELDKEKYPFSSSIAERMLLHDDRADFSTGIDVILVGLRYLGASNPH